jgi:hypothetical protein
MYHFDVVGSLASCLTDFASALFTIRQYRMFLFCVCTAHSRLFLRFLAVIHLEPCFSSYFHKRSYYLVDVSSKEFPRGCEQATTSGDGK